MKMMIKAALLLVFAIPTLATAATIAIVDSGTDYRHKDLVDQYAINTKEIAGNRRDDDSNGFVDDVYGYNLAEKTAAVIDYAYLKRLAPTMPDIHKFFEVQVRLLDRTATEEDKAWLKSKRGDEKFIKEMGVFGNFAHGTHVAGIVGGHSTTVNPDNHVFAVKIMPTEVKLPFSVQYSNSAAFRSIVGSTKSWVPVGIRMYGLGLGLRFLAKMQTGIFGEVGEYVARRGADVANGSFGSGYAQLRTVVEMLYNLVFKENERSAAQVDQLTRAYSQQILINARAMPLAAPKTLFVFAAGNDGSDNDAVLCSPANLREPNTITVAATLRNRELATFSNYGASKVDVAAPGVGIASLYPGDEHGLMSGTSQAAPYVAGVAAAMKNENPALTPAQLKEILMGTVDTKEWLIGKVNSNGFVNPERAIFAARLSRDTFVSDAIRVSLYDVKNVVVNEPSPEPGEHSLGDVGVLPLVSPIQ